MPKKVPVQIKMTKPESKLKYRVEYPNGEKKWVKERPGHKSDKWKIREKKRLLRNPAVKDFLIKMENVINSYRNEEATDDDIRKTVRDFETTLGVNKAKMVVRRLSRSEKAKLEKAKEQDVDVDYHQSVVDALDIAVKFSSRKRRDNPKKASIVSRIGYRRVTPKKKLGNVLLGFYDKEDFCLVNYISNCQRTKGKDKTSVKESQSKDEEKAMNKIAVAKELVKIARELQCSG